MRTFEVGITLLTKTNSLALSPRANYTDWAVATCRRNLVPTLVDRGMSRGQRGGSPTVGNLSFLDRSRYFFFQIAPHLSSWGWVDLVPDPLLLRKSGSAGNWTQDLWICTQELCPLDHRGGHVITKLKLIYTYICHSIKPANVWALLPISYHDIRKVFFFFVIALFPSLLPSLGLIFIFLFHVTNNFLCVLDFPHNSSVFYLSSLFIQHLFLLCLVLFPPIFLSSFLPNICLLHPLLLCFSLRFIVRPTERRVKSLEVTQDSSASAGQPANQGGPAG
jgi:hypothetical protein